MVDADSGVTTPDSRVVVDGSVVITPNHVITTQITVTREIKMEERVGGKAFMDLTRGERAFTFSTVASESGLPKHTVWRLTQILLDAGVVHKARRVRNLDSKDTFIYAYAEATPEDVAKAQRKHIATRMKRRRT